MEAKKTNGIPIRISQKLYEEAKIAANKEFRTIPQQIYFWSSVGHYLEMNPNKTITDFLKEQE